MCITCNKVLKNSVVVVAYCSRANVHELHKSFEAVLKNISEYSIAFDYHTDLFCLFIMPINRYCLRNFSAHALQMLLWSNTCSY